MKCIIYARVSSKEQESEGFSIPAQLKLLHEYATQNGLEVQQEFTDIETAKKSGRTAFTKMMTFLEENTDVRTVLVEKTDRLYRNFKDYVILEDYELSIHLVKEGQVISKDSRSHEKFIHGIKVLMAKNFIDNLSEEVKKGLKEKVAQGGYPGSAPFGYINNKDEKTIEPDPEVAPIVRQLFEWYATGDYSIKTLRSKAKRAGLLDNFHKYRTSTSTIHNVLKNPVYCGKVKFKGEMFDGSHFPLITETTFKKAQSILSGNAQTQAKTKRQFTYMGLLNCAVCGCSITAEIKKGKYIYYHCTNGKGACSKNYVREEVIDKQIKDILQSIKLDDTRLEWVKEALKLSHKEEKGFHQKIVKSFQLKIAELQSKIDKAYDDKLEGKIPEELWTSKFKQWSDQKENLQIQLNAHQRANKSYYESGVKLIELSNRAYELYEKQDVKEKQKLLKFLLSNSKMQGNTVDFELKMPFSLIVESKKSENWLGMVSQMRTKYGYEVRFFREIIESSNVNDLMLKVA